MRRLGMILLWVFLLSTAVSAAGAVTNMQSNTTVHSNGSSEVTLTVQLTLDQIPAQLVFPLPAEAKDISLNGSPARTALSNGVRNVNLGSLIRLAGSHSFVIRYSMPDAVTADKSGNLFLTLKLLSGFAYPIDKMEFSVSLPGAPEKRPEFISTYHQETVDSIMTYDLEGATIRCSFTQGLKDHESLTMTLPVSEEMFPQPIIKKWSLSADDVAMYICAGIAFIYWLVFLRALPPKRLRRTHAPAGLNAGELGCCLSGQGVDFSMTVISWAQMGYLLIQVNDSSRVLLHKRMEIGNERSEFENRCFRTLFKNRKTVDATGHHFAQLAAKAAKTIPGARNYYLRSSGNPNIFRMLCALIGIFGGISLALSLANDTAWQVILSLLLGCFGAVLSWQIHAGAGVLHLRNRLPLSLSLAGSALWLFLSLWSGEWGVSLFVLGCQWLAGLAVAYGGRRTEGGKVAMSEILGLRRYLKTISKEELHHILETNPEYFYDLAPYALALGVDRAFARQAGNRKLPECTYLTTGMDGHITPQEWNQLLREAVATLNEQQQKMAFKKWLGR